MGRSKANGLLRISSVTSKISGTETQALLKPRCAEPECQGPEAKQEGEIILFMCLEYKAPFVVLHH